jgi:phage replication initiation protein
MQDGDYRTAAHKIIRELPNCNLMRQLKYDLANIVLHGLAVFNVAPEFKRGHDFYKFRWVIQ